MTILVHSHVCCAVLRCGRGVDAGDELETPLRAILGDPELCVLS